MIFKAFGALTLKDTIFTLIVCGKPKTLFLNLIVTFVSTIEKGYVIYENQNFGVK